MLTALISLVSGLVSGVVPDVLKEIKDTRAHAREVDFLQINQKLALERAQYEQNIKVEEYKSNAMLADIQAGEHNFDALMQQAMKPVGIAWVDGLNAVVRPMTALVFMVLFAIGILSFIFGFGGGGDAQFGATMTGLFSEAIQAVIGFMFGSRAVRSVLPKAG